MHLPVILPLSQVTSSKCEVDEDWFHQERVATEQDCRAFCDSWLPEPGCKFSAWIPDDPYNCRLYTESFHFYLRQVSELATYARRCEVMAGPPLSEFQGCSLEEPAENSCEGVRYHLPHSLHHTPF